MVSFSIPHSLAIIGAIIALEGTIVIAISQVFEKTESIIDRCSSYWGYNPPLIKSTIDQKMKNGFSLVEILIGSMAQIASIAFSWTSFQEYYCPLWLIFVIAGLPIFIYFIYFKPKIHRVQEKVLKKVEERNH